MICGNGNLPKYIEIPLPAVLRKFDAKKRTMLNIRHETKMLSELIKSPPSTNESFRMISAGGFSSIAFIRYIAETENILELYASSLTIGKKHMENLNMLHKQNKIKKAFFVFCSIFEKSNNAKYNYFDKFKSICSENDWKFAQAKNHSKILLMKTKNNFYVVETSSNLNENPKIEQFTFENDKKLYEFYLEFFNSVLGCDTA